VCCFTHFQCTWHYVNVICATTDNVSLDTVIATRRITFLQSLQDVHGRHPVLHNLYARIGKRELFWLTTLTDDWSVMFAWYSSTVYVVCFSLSFFFSFIFSHCILSVCCLILKVYTHPHTPTHTHPTERCNFEWPWVTLSDLGLTRFLTTWSVARSLCDSWASCCYV